MSTPLTNPVARHLLRVTLLGIGCALAVVLLMPLSATADSPAADATESNSYDATDSSADDATEPSSVNATTSNANFSDVTPTAVLPFFPAGAALGLAVICALVGTLVLLRRRL